MEVDSHPQIIYTTLPKMEQECYDEHPEDANEEDYDPNDPQNLVDCGVEEEKEYDEAGAFIDETFMARGDIERFWKMANTSDIFRCTSHGKLPRSEAVLLYAKYFDGLKEAFYTALDVRVRLVAILSGCLSSMPKLRASIETRGAKQLKSNSSVTSSADFKGMPMDWWLNQFPQPGELDSLQQMLKVIPANFASDNVSLWNDFKKALLPTDQKANGDITDALNYHRVHLQYLQNQMSVFGNHVQIYNDYDWREPCGCDHVHRMFDRFFDNLYQFFTSDLNGNSLGDDSHFAELVLVQMLSIDNKLFPALCRAFETEKRRAKTIISFASVERDACPTSFEHDFPRHLLMQNGVASSLQQETDGKRADRVHATFKRAEEKLEVPPECFNYTDEIGFWNLLKETLERILGLLRGTNRETEPWKTMPIAPLTEESAYLFRDHCEDDEDDYDE